jgi:hypothetical protein
VRTRVRGLEFPPVESLQERSVNHHELKIRGSIEQLANGVVKLEETFPTMMSEEGWGCKRMRHREGKYPSKCNTVVGVIHGHTQRNSSWQPRGFWPIITLDQLGGLIGGRGSLRPALSQCNQVIPVYTKSRKV